MNLPRMLWLLLSLPALMITQAFAGAVYQSNEDFLTESFSQEVPEPQVIWLRGEVKKQVKIILGHNYASLRVRYWSTNEKSAWILEEIGKERPITTGIIISNRKIDRVKVLAFRESRGAEVRHNFFTKQFLGVQLTGEQQLDRSIDGITGATLSVRALKKLARLALYLDSTLDAGNDT